MAQIIPGSSENIESILRRFKREVSKSGLFQDIKKNRYFETPNEKFKRKERSRHRQGKRRKNHR